MMPVLDLSLPSFTSFADRHGYTLQVSHVSADDADRWSATAKRVRWEKVSIIQSTLEQSDVVVWLDADVLLCRTDTDILDSLGAYDYQGLVLHSVPFENRITPNTGVWVIRNTEKSFRFLDRVSEIGMPEGRWADQGAVLRALEWILGDEHYHGARMSDTPNQFMKGTAWLPLGWNLPYCGNRTDEVEYAGRPAVANPFAIHFSRMPIPDRVKYMREIVDHPSPQPIMQTGGNRVTSTTAWL